MIINANFSRPLLTVPWSSRSARILRLPPRPQFHPLAVGGFDIDRRAQADVAGRTVDDDGIARFDQAGGVGDLADGGNAKRAGDDGDVRGRPAFFQHQPAQAFAVVVEQRRRAHGVAGDQNGVFRQLLARGRMVVAHQHPHQPVGEIVEVVEPVAQIRIGGSQHARAGVGLHAFDAGFGGGGRSTRLLLFGAASPGRRRTCDRLRAHPGARRRRRRRGARPGGRGRRRACGG